jgi:RecA-family ATPase
MKTNPDINDTHREQGEDAARERHDKARKFDTKQHNNGRDRGPQPLPFVDMSTWDANAPPSRYWLINNLIPLRQPTLITGPGGGGKSILLLQLLASTALNVPWLEIYQPMPGPVIYLGCEDEEDEIYRRLAAILIYHNRNFADLTEAGFKLLAYAGENAALAEFDRSGRIKQTSLFQQLHQAAVTLQPKAIVIDTVSDVFIGDEIDRAQVRQFCSLLRKLAIDANASVLASSHPSLTGMKSGSGLSGSTQWHNSVRARAYFTTPNATDDDDKTDDGRRELQFLKNQYAPAAQVVSLQWQNGLWLPVSEKAAAQVNVEELFLILLRRFDKEGRSVSAIKSPTYAPAKFADTPEAKTAKISSTAFVAAMERLFALNKIRIEKDGPPSRIRSWIAENKPDLADVLRQSTRREDRA